IRQHHVDNDKDPDVSTTSELLALAWGPTWTPILTNSCIVDGVSFKKSSSLINHKKFSDGGVIVVEDDPDIIHFDNSSDLPLSTILNDLDNVTLNIDDALPHDLADSDVEDLINVDDDGIEKVYFSEKKIALELCRQQMLHGPTAVTMAVRIVLLHPVYPPVSGVASLIEAKDIAEAKGPVSIHFDVGDKQTLNPLGPHVAHWSNYIGEVVRSVPLCYPSWEKVPKEQKAAIILNIGTLFDLRPHMESSRWTEIYEGINQHLQKDYNTNKASFKAKHWKVDPQTETYAEEITADE
ncbi:hypothetical protein Tco_1451358, partial [Tanacetum coccineum]